MKDVALVGLPGVGKSTIFSAVARTHAAPGVQKPNVAVVRVPDGRLDELVPLLGSAKAVPAQVRLVDVPGLGPQSLGEARETDALAVVCAAFSEVADPVRDLSSFRTECVVADLSTVERSLERVRRKLTAGAGPAGELATMERAERVLSSDRWLREETWTPTELGVLRNIGALTLKPVLGVANVDEAWDGTDPGLGQPSLAIRGLLEAEAADLPPDEAGEMLRTFGVDDSATARFVQAIFELLDLVCFFTGNEKEARAWEVPRGTKAPQAAGQVHTDFEKGFIRWEAVSYGDFVELGSWDAARTAGRLRVEGRDYEVRDGDVVRILHS